MRRSEAGWHTPGKLDVPANISILTLPSRAIFNSSTAPTGKSPRWHDQEATTKVGLWGFALAVAIALYPALPTRANSPELIDAFWAVSSAQWTRHLRGCG